MAQVKDRHPFNIGAILILPDHFCAIWTLPMGDCGFQRRWALIKAGFSMRILCVENAMQAGSRRTSADGQVRPRRSSAGLALFEHPLG